MTMRTFSRELWVAVLCLAVAGGATLAGQENLRKPAQAPETPKQNTSNLPDPSLIKIDEFRIQISEETAGLRRTGSISITEVVNPFKVRKRGRVYGSVYEFHRNDNFDARNFFDPVGQKLPEFKRNQFGGSFGTLLSDRLTLFGTFDGLRINRGSTILAHVPTREMKKGDFSALSKQLVDPFTGLSYTNNQLPSIHPVAAKMLSVIPDPNRSDPFRNFVNNLPEVQNTDTYTARVDYEFSKNSKLFGN